MKLTSHFRDSSLTSPGIQTLGNASATGILVPGLYATAMSNSKHQRIIFWRRDCVSTMFFLKICSKSEWSDFMIVWRLTRQYSNFCSQKLTARHPFFISRSMFLVYWRHAVDLSFLLGLGCNMTVFYASQSSFFVMSSASWCVSSHLRWTQSWKGS